jgi:hypothetical protein
VLIERSCYDPMRAWRLLLAIHKSLGAADQIHSDLVRPLVIEGTGSTAECVEVDRRRANHLHPIHVLQQLVELRGLYRRIMPKSSRLNRIRVRSLPKQLPVVFAAAPIR